jgi:hypothetical protein
MTDCNDSLESKNASNLISTTGFAYSPTIQIYQLDAIRANFEKNVVYVPASNEFVDLYGQEVFNQALIAFNNFLSAANTNTNLNLPVNYPLVQDRIDRGVAITPVELTIFMQDSGYNPVSIQAAMTTGPKNVLSLYNSNINGNFSKSTMGTFCELAPAIFGAIAGFFTTIGAIANTIADIINKIQNFSLAALLDELKKKITDVIEKTIEKVKKIIENFTLEGLVKEVEQYFHQNIVAKFEILRDEALAFFEQFNVENFKKRVDGLISYATGIFKDLKLEEIQFLIYRFCSFITQVEDMINGLKNPLEAFTNRYVYAGKILESNSSVVTAAAVAAGAHRPGKDELAAAIAAGITAESIRGNQPPPTTEERKDVPTWDGVMSGRDTRLVFGSKWSKPPASPRSKGGMGKLGWDYSTENSKDVKVYLMRVYKAFSTRTGINQLIITSHYRDPEYNASIKGASTTSLHMSGLAFDISWAGYPKYRNDFIEIAKSYDFNGIGVYGPKSGNFVHIDRGRNSTWSKP